MRPDAAPGLDSDCELQAGDLSCLIEGLAVVPPAHMPPQAARMRLVQRVREAVTAALAFNTVRLGRAPSVGVAPGVVTRTLYSSPASPLRLGEPQRVRLIELAAGAAWSHEDTGAMRREWLLIEGSANIDHTPLRPGSYHVAEGAGPAALHSPGGAWMYLRETPLAAANTAATCTQHDDPALWLDFAPGIQRRLLWQHGPEAAMLYRAQAGATVPAHGHGHDEECLTLEGEVFLDDVLLQRGDYQIAPAGTGHSGVFTDTGALIYAHGDLDLAVL